MALFVHVAIRDMAILIQVAGSMFQFVFNVKVALNTGAMMMAK